MRIAALTCVAGAILLSGCGPRMSIADQCSRYGYPPGSAGHANCQMQLSIAEENRQQRQGDALIHLGNQLMQPPPAPASGMTTYRMPSGHMMTCSRFGNVVNCR